MALVSGRSVLHAYSVSQGSYWTLLRLHYWPNGVILCAGLGPLYMSGVPLQCQFFQLSEKAAMWTPMGNPGWSDSARTPTLHSLERLDKFEFN